MRYDLGIERSRNDKPTFGRNLIGDGEKKNSFRIITRDIQLQKMILNIWDSQSLQIDELCVTKQRSPSSG